MVYLSALTVINALTRRQKNTSITYPLLLSFWNSAHSSLWFFSFLMDSAIPWRHLFLLLFADFVLPLAAGYPQLYMIYLLGFVFLFSFFSGNSSPSLFLSVQFPCLVLALLLYVSTPSVCYAPLQFCLPSPWISPGHPVPSTHFLRRAEPRWWHFPCRTSQLLRCLSRPPQVPWESWGSYWSRGRSLWADSWRSTNWCL